MKAKWNLTVITICIILFIASLIGCNPRTRLVQGGAGSPLATRSAAPPLALTPGVVSAVPAEPHTGQLIPLPPTPPAGTAINPAETPLQPVPGGSASGSDAARLDLAKRLGLPLAAVRTVAVTGQEFSREAFYCQLSKDRIVMDEQPAVISGLTILLEASGHAYEYHASGQTVVFCRPVN